MSTERKSFKELSRQIFSKSPIEDTTYEMINAGSLQRIADATELMAKNHDDLIRRAQFLEESRNNWRSQAEASQRQVNALKGVITKLKKKLNENRSK